MGLNFLERHCVPVLPGFCPPIDFEVHNLARSTRQIPCLSDHSSFGLNGGNYGLQIIRTQQIQLKEWQRPILGSDRLTFDIELKGRIRFQPKRVRRRGGWRCIFNQANADHRVQQRLILRGPADRDLVENLRSDSLNIWIVVSDQGPEPRPEALGGPGGYLGFHQRPHWYEALDNLVLGLHSDYEHSRIELVAP